MPMSAPEKSVFARLAEDRQRSMDEQGLTFTAFCEQLKEKLDARERPQTYDKEIGTYVDGNPRADYATQMKALSLWAQVAGFIVRPIEQTDGQKAGEQMVLDAGYAREGGGEWRYVDPADLTVAIKVKEKSPGNGAADH